MAVVRRGRRGRRPVVRSAVIAGTAVVVVLALGMLGLGSAQADPVQAGSGHITGEAAPQLPKTPSVAHVSQVRAHFVAPANQASRRFAPTRTAWPRAATGIVHLPAPAAGATNAAIVRAPGTPVWAALATAHTTAAGPDTVAVKVLDHSAAVAAGIHGVLFTLTPSAGTGSSPEGTTGSIVAASAVRVGVDYSAFAQAEGGDYASRLRLVRVPACILSTPALAACRAQTPLRSANDSRAQTVSAPVSLKVTSAASTPDTSATASAATVKSSSVSAVSMVFAVTPAATTPGDGGGNGGTYAATTLSPSGTWSQGDSSGAFTYDYPITVPPARSSLTPAAGLAYDSAAVDGKTASTQAQSSWVGDGWSTPQSYVEQSFVPCADSPEGSASPSATSDDCYDGQVLTLSLQGATTSLVWDAGSSTWKEQGDDGEVVTHVTSSNNDTGTYNTDYWKITERDGTVYQFGRNQLPGWSSGKAETHSVQSEPVYSAHSGDPCYHKTAATFAGSVCTMAYRWNLDYVTDVHAEAMAYYYTPATNFYGENNGASNVSYVRDAYLSHIDYGFSDGGAYGMVGDKVVFTTGERCVSGTCTLNAANAANYPDVPFSDICASGATCTSYAPSFFSTVRLTGISTQQYSTASSSYVTVDSYALTQTIPATGDGGAVTPTLWLASVQHTGSDTSAGAGSSTTLPAVTFSGQQLQNRTDATSLPGFFRFRLSGITTETGSVIAVSYGLANPCSVPVTVTAASNTSSCYPVSWTPAGYSAPIMDWFDKYVVTGVTQTDPTGGAVPLSTSYTYKGGAAWHYDDNEEVQAKYRTYGQFRGYGDVQTRTGDKTNDPQTLSEETYYRGMSKDNNSTVVNVTDSQGGAHEDLNQLAGQVLESTSYLGDGGPVDHSTITSYWVSPATATRTRTGLPALTANLVAPAEEYTRQAVTTGGSSTWRYTETDRSYDASISSATFGLEKTTYTHTSPANAAYDSCTSTAYAAVNTGENLVGLPAEVETDTVACGGFSAGSPASVPASLNALSAPSTVSRPGQVAADLRTFYDDPAFSTTFPQASAPTTGNVTMVRTASTYSGGFTYQTTKRAAFDTYGRPVKAYDGNGNLTSTAYTDNSAGLTTAVTTTNPLSQVTSTTMDTERALPLVGTDANHVSTTTQYDALGRTTGVWLDSRATSSPANYLYTYVVSKTAITAVTSLKMNDSGGYYGSITLYDALLRVRETQAWTPQSGRMVSENLYDSRGWVYQKNTNWWDSATTPNTTLITGAISAIPDADVYTFDGLGRTVVDNSEKYGVSAAKTTTVFNGDRTTTIPPTGGTTQATVVDPLGRTSELDQYTGAPTLNLASNPFTGVSYLTGGTTTKTSYGYDGHGNQSTVTDDTGATWASTYNLLGQVTAKSDPDAGASTMVYDGDGNLTQSTDSRGQSVSTVYDALNRKTAQYAATTTAQSTANQVDAWVYDNSNNAVTGMSNPIGQQTTQTAYWGGAAYTTQEKGFNVFGESLGETVTIPASTEGTVLGVSYVFQHVYSTNTGLLLRDISPAAGGLPSESPARSYNAFDQPATLGGYATASTYDAYGRVEQVTLNGSPNQAFVTDTYDAHTGQLTDQLVTSRSGSNPVTTDDEQAYSYDPDLNVTKQTDTQHGSTASSETQCYGYDNVQRLTGAWTATDNCAAAPTPTSHAMVADNLGAASAYWSTWSFNTLGERSTQVQHSLTGGTDTTTTSTYNGNTTGQPHTLTGTATTGGATSTAAFGYDSAGNMTSRQAGQGPQTLTWNAAGQLTTVTAGATTSSYEYDASGNLLIQKDPGATTLYLPGEQITLNTATNTTTGIRYAALPGGAIGYRTGAGNSYGYEITDLHDTPYLQLDYTAQTPTWRQFTPYGAPRGTTTGWLDNRSFLDKTTDTTTGLTNIGARSYDPVTGAFISLDPILGATAPQTLNGYTYSAANPTTLADPTGLMPLGDPDCTCGPIKLHPQQPAASPRSPSTGGGGRRNGGGGNSSGGSGSTFTTWLMSLDLGGQGDGNASPDSSAEQKLKDGVRGVGDTAWSTLPGFAGEICGWVHFGSCKHAIDSAQASLDKWGGGNSNSSIYKSTAGISTVAAVVVAWENPEIDAAAAEDAVSEANVAYRVIRPNENPAEGLLAKNPAAAYTPEGHVLNGSRPGFASQYISTTRDLGVAQKWAGLTGNRIVGINLDMVNGPITDLSTAAGRQAFLKGATARNFAAASREVLIEGPVPSEALFEP